MEELILNGKICLSYIKNAIDHIGKQKFKIDEIPTFHPRGVPCSELWRNLDRYDKKENHTRISEHNRNFRYDHSEKWAVAEHSLRQDNHIVQFEDPQVLDRSINCYPRLFSEAIEFQKLTRNFNWKEEGFDLSNSWMTVLGQIKIVPVRTGNTSADNNHKTTTRETRPLVKVQKDELDDCRPS